MFVGALIVALVWGITNPFLRHFSSGITGNSLSSDFWFLFSRPGYLLSLVVNLSGSVLFYLLLRDGDLSVVSPLCNGLTFAVTLVSGRLFFREQVSMRAAFGVIFIVLGTAVIANAK